MSRFLTASATAFALALSAASVLAQEQAPAESPAGGLELQRPIGLTAAVQAAEAEVPGSTLEAEMESENGRIVYEIELVTAGDEVRRILVDAATGDILSNEEQTVSGLWRNWFESDMPAASQSLADILTAVEQETGAEAMEISLDDDEGRAVYEIELRGQNGRDTEVIVDAASGLITREDD